jgi:hypothetical protein
MQSKIEKVCGNIFAGILLAIIIWSFSYSVFCLLFRDGRGIGLYGSRGDFYMYDGY